MNYEELNIDEKIVDLVNKEEKKLSSEFALLDDICFHNSLKVLNAFHKYGVCENDFKGTTGYGYNDSGREKIEKIFAEVLGAEDALVRREIISGTHALTVCFFGLLRPNDLLLSITGKPYDTLDEVIGIRENKSSLKSFGVRYDQIDLVADDFDYEKIEDYLKNNKVKVIEIQRSKGYSTRKTIGNEKIEKVISLIKKIDSEVIVMIDNCYCEFVTKDEPLKFGADVIVGSLIKNLGGGIAPNGGYIAGKKELVELASERLTVPGEGKEVGPTIDINKSFLQGLYLAPKVVNSSLKVAVLASKVLEELGYKVEPKYNDKRHDIVQNIIFEDKEKLIKYCQGIQGASAIDSNALPIPSEMPGYEDEIIMASGSFTQGSSIELSCDGPIRSPYIAYMQGSMCYEYGKIAIMKAITNIKN